MDSARIRRSTSSPPRVLSDTSLTRAHSDANDVAIKHTRPEPDQSPSRQQKLLNTRNHRFPAKKLSIAGIGTKLSQFITKNDQSEQRDAPSRDQENNTLHKSRSTGTIGKRRSLAILEGISGTARSQSARQREEIPIFQDNAEKPLLQSSPFVSSPYIDPRGEFNSPLGFDHIQDTLNDMRLRELSLNVDWSPAVKSPPPKYKSLKRSAPSQFDADDYIEHIEKELQQTREEAYSPLTRRPMKEKLRAANRENERLQKELAQLREKFETEVKRTVEHKTMAELELRRRVRDLEGSLEEKNHTIRELKYQHEERRLDNNIIDSLKATIERLEQDKTDMEEINLGMSKRNEVLTQLLAMSPTKLSDGFNLRSPVRDKRNARPISLILPRQPTSPNGMQRKPNSIVCSPRALNSADVSPFRLSPAEEYSLQSGQRLQQALVTPQQESADPMNAVQSPVRQTRSRRSTLHSEISVSSGGGNGIANFASDDKIHTRRKARRFMGGSTQLKPLLLPSLTGDSMPISSASTASSPRSWSRRLASDVDIEDTILPGTDAQNQSEGVPEIIGALGNSSPDGEVVGNDGPGPVISDDSSILRADAGERVGACIAEGGDEELDQFSQPQELADTHPEIQHPGVELSTKHLELHNSQYSMHMMPIPETPDSLIALPQPLFSNNCKAKAGQDTFEDFSGSPCVLPEQSWSVNVRKKRKNSLSTFDCISPAPKVHRSQQYQPSCGEMHPSQLPCGTASSSSTSSAQKRLSQIRSTDNFVELLRQKNFAARPLAALTIRTVYTLLSTCASAVHAFRKDPFALARKVLANAWRMNWKALGKVSWWVLGLFIQPQNRSKVRATIDWDRYDGESIASRYCGSVSQQSDDRMSASEQENEHTQTTRETNNYDSHDNLGPENRPSWGQSMYLWGKFSAALVLAVGGVVVKGPREMLKDVKTEPKARRRRHKSCKTCSGRNKQDRALHDVTSTPQPQQVGKPVTPLNLNDTVDGGYTSDFDFRFELDSSALLEDIQQLDCDSTLRPETAKRGRLGSLFTVTPSSGELVSKMRGLKLDDAHSMSNTPHMHDPGPFPR